MTDVQGEVAEAALAHVVKDKTEAAYRRRDPLEKRRSLMPQWADDLGRASLEQKSGANRIPPAGDHP